MINLINYHNDNVNENAWHIQHETEDFYKKYNPELDSKKIKILANEAAIIFVKDQMQKPVVRRINFYIDILEQLIMIKYREGYYE